MDYFQIHLFYRFDHHLHHLNHQIDLEHLKEVHHLYHHLHLQQM
jgi:hypothetical protein